MVTMLKVNDVAAMVQVSVGTIYRYVEKNEIPFTKIKRAVRFMPSDIQEWLDKRKAGLSVQQVQGGDVQGGVIADTAADNGGNE